MKKTQVILSILSLTFGFSQSIDDSIKGPITGFTYVPPVGKFDISANLVAVSTNSEFDNSGNEQAYSKLFEGIADPEISTAALYLAAEYSVNQKIGVLVSIPLVIKQELKMNPSSGYKEFFTDLNGETGLGDITVGGWYQLSKNYNSSIMVLGRYTLATGTSPDDVGDSNFSSTGSGHTKIGASVVADFMMTPKILASLGGDYTVNQEASFSSDGYSWDVKAGNEFRIIGRLSLMASSQLSLGLGLNYYSDSEDKTDGEKIQNSDSNSIVLTPKVGYQILTGTSTVNISCGYLLNISGKNYSKSGGLVVGSTMFF